MLFRNTWRQVVLVTLKPCYIWPFRQWFRKHLFTSAVAASRSTRGKTCCDSIYGECTLRVASMCPVSAWPYKQLGENIICFSVSTARFHAVCGRGWQNCLPDYFGLGFRIMSETIYAHLLGTSSSELCCHLLLAVDYSHVVPGIWRKFNVVTNFTISRLRCPLKIWQLWSC